MPHTEAVLKFSWDWGRVGEIEGLFVAPVEWVEKSIGCEANFGEAMGKHSDVRGVLSKEDFTLITSDPKVVEIFKEYNLSSGYNPLDYVFDEDGYEVEWSSM